MTEPKLIELQLPYPISGNRYWRKGRGKAGKNGPGFTRTYISHEARLYRNTVSEMYRQIGKVEPLSGNLVVTLELYRGDKRLDADNSTKVLFDSLQQAGVYLDDNQIVEYHVRRWDLTGKNKRKRAYVIVRIETDQKGGNEWLRLNR